jgi:hypothetical protein
MGDIKRVLDRDLMLATQGLKQPEQEMSDKWDKLPQLSTPAGKHVASSTGFHEVAGANTSTLDLENKSPPPGPLLDKTGVVVLDPGDEGNEVRETTESIKRITDHRSTRRPMKMKWPGSEKDLPLIPRSNNPDKEKRMRLQKKGRTVFPRKRILTIRRTVLLTVTRMPGVAPDLLQVQQGIEGVTLDPLIATVKETTEDKESHLSHGQITTRMPGVTPGLQQVLDKKHLPMKDRGSLMPRGDHTHHCLLVILANSNLKVNYRTTWKRHIQLRILIAK